jgi:hypothetical protein
LVRGLASVGRRVEAAEVFWNYMHRDRLSHAPLSVDLVEIEKTEIGAWSSKGADAVEDHVFRN